MSKSTLEALLIRLLSRIQIINPSTFSKEEMAKEIKLELVSEWKEFKKKKDN